MSEDKFIRMVRKAPVELTPDSLIWLTEGTFRKGFKTTIYKYGKLELEDGFCPNNGLLIGSLKPENELYGKCKICLNQWGNTFFRRNGNVVSKSTRQYHCTLCKFRAEGEQYVD